MSDNNMEFGPDIITLVDDEGTEYEFEVLDVIEIDSGRYAALLPTYDDPKEFLDDSGEMVIVKIEEEDGEEVYSEIEDDDEYETVADVFIDRLQDIYEFNEEN